MEVKLNELTNLDEKEATVVTRDQMMETVEQLDEAGTFYTFSKDKKGISVVRTLRDVYRIHSEFSQSVTEFEVQTGLIKLKIDAVSDEAMSNFVERGLHYNISSIDFKAVPEDKSELVCIDIVASYASFHKCRLYMEFPNKLTDLRPTDKIEGPGFYLIDQLLVARLSK